MIIAGVMSGTSSEGCDAVLAHFAEDSYQILGDATIHWSDKIRHAILELSQSTSHEIDKTYRLGITLADYYAQAVHLALQKGKLSIGQLRACAVHGQTLRHQPHKGYSVQCLNMAQLAETLQVDIVGDFRSRDIAAGGQGAPLACGFHQWCFAAFAPCAILNLGGIANLTIVQPNMPTLGFDCGPGNMLLDYWMELYRQQRYDHNGEFAATGEVNQSLLQTLLRHQFFQQSFPKSTGRDDFHPHWLHQQLAPFSLAPQDVMATLVALSSNSIADQCKHFPQVKRVIACGGGVHNKTLMQYIAKAIAPTLLETTTCNYGIPSQQVEALAFAWMGWQTLQRKCANVPSATGATGNRILGCIYPGAIAIA